ncbi:tRNA (N6-isopentenyl adenosine(37)-C2)-methylthiotransferase MiaB [Vicingaceae bacterium]|nr:tRNA (N6-isopentenyl adenosine(37)-C2)-methylthiotransferase MiaB [Vicingaceae bacterium]
MLRDGIKEIDESRQGEAITIDQPINKNNNRKVYIESYGCQMNFADSEVVASILTKDGFSTTKELAEADLILLNTCSIRDKAEQTIRKRLANFNTIKKNKPEMVIGVLGCMAERLKSKLIDEEKLVDLVVGPDAYRDLPNLVEEVDNGHKAVNVILSKEETYAEIEPIRMGGNGVTAFVSITRGCDNMCTFCVVPFTRGRERSRDPKSIVNEATQLFEQGYREVTLLGQNVDSYLWYGGGLKKEFNNLSEEEKSTSVNFAQLMEMVAQVNPLLRVRFSTSHPKDLTDDVIYTIAKYDNICNYIHLPVQSGNNRILELMNRGYTKDWYKERIDKIWEVIPDCSISSDIIAGFCSETDEEHEETLDMMRYVRYQLGYMFKYSERPNTIAQRKFEDDIPEEIKQKRLEEIITVHRENAHFRNNEMVGKVYEVLIEGTSKKSEEELYGRTPQNAVAVFPKENHTVGTYVNILIESCTTGTLIGKVVNV